VTKIDTYYRFDGSIPCVMNLSSLIDLPASAFNSSFPSSVLISDLSLQNDQHPKINAFTNYTNAKFYKRPFSAVIV
jgi:hypothetical protein